MGAEAAGRAAARSGAARRQLRPAAEGAGNRSDDRPRHRQPAGRHRQPDRQHAVRRLRPAPGLDDLQRAEPVSRRHGGGAALLAEPGDAEGHLCQHVGRHCQRHARRRTRWSAPSPRRSNHQQPRQSTAATIANSSARNAATNALANTGKGSASSGAAVSTSKETMVPLAAFTALRARQHAAGGQPSGASSSPPRSPSTWRPASRSATRPRSIDEAMRQIRHAGHHPRQLPGHGADLPAVAVAASRC